MGIYTMENGKLKVTVADYGAELVNIFDKANQRELIWQAFLMWANIMAETFPTMEKNIRRGSMVLPEIWLLKGLKAMGIW